ncbi:MAG: adenylate kinase [Chloroflexi bacterium]|nr:adenylate kinase [Chloroflexota bacterium]
MVAGRYRVTLLIGGPGAGKGTQAKYLSETLRIPHIASGDLLRDHRRRGTPLGRAAQTYMDRGDLVPDGLVVDLMMNRLAAPDATRGALLDGFPRTVAQAEALDTALARHDGGVHAALYLDVPAEVLVERLCGRWFCGGCQQTYNERIEPLPSDMRCSACGTRLGQRPDDRCDVIEHRVEVYFHETAPVLSHYSGRRLLHRLNGNRTPDDVRDALLDALRALAAPRELAPALPSMSHRDVALSPSRGGLG